MSAPTASTTRAATAGSAACATRTAAASSRMSARGSRSRPTSATAARRRASASCANASTSHADCFIVNEKTVYRYVNGGLLHTKRHDLPRACMLKPRKAKSVEHKVDAKCRIGRTYADYLCFIAQNPGLPVTEIDTGEGVKGGKVLLTLMFMPYGFLAAFLLPVKTAAHVSSSALRRQDGTRWHGAGAGKTSGGRPHGFAKHPHKMEHVGVAGHGCRFFDG